MSRLTKTTKEEIVRNAVVAAKIPENREVNRARRAKWAECVRLLALGGRGASDRVESAAKSISKILTHLPKDVKTGHSPLHKDSRVRLNLAGKRVFAYFSGAEGYSQNEAHKFTADSYTLPGGHELSDEFGRIDDIERALDDLETALSVKVWAILNSTTTIKKLLSVWPEAKELLPSAEASVATLPAVPTAELNKLLGLGD